MSLNSGSHNWTNAKYVFREHRTIKMDSWNLLSCQILQDLWKCSNWLFYIVPRLHSLKCRYVRTELSCFLLIARSWTHQTNPEGYDFRPTNYLPFKEIIEFQDQILQVLIQHAMCLYWLVSRYNLKIQDIKILHTCRFF